MGKKSRRPSIKSPKHEKQIHSSIKILRPKVYITDSSNFKNLVQQLTGNGISQSSSPPALAASPPSELPWTDIQDHAYQENSLDLSFDSSCFSTPLEGSPEFRVADPFNYGMDDAFLSQYMDLESLLMEMDSVPNSYGSSCGITHQQEVSVYDYDISSFI